MVDQRIEEIKVDDIRSYMKWFRDHYKKDADDIYPLTGKKVEALLTHIKGLEWLSDDKTKSIGKLFIEVETYKSQLKAKDEVFKQIVSAGLVDDAECLNEETGLYETPCKVCNGEKNLAVKALAEQGKGGE